MFLLRKGGSRQTLDSISRTWNLTSIASVRFPSSDEMRISDNFISSLATRNRFAEKRTVHERLSANAKSLPSEDDADNDDGDLAQRYRLDQMVMRSLPRIVYQGLRYG